MIEQERIKLLNKKNINSKGNFVLYWMQASQRASFNHALEYSILKSNEFSLPLIVSFNIVSDYPEANIRHYYFMLQGLKETQRNLADRNIKMVVLKGSLSKSLNSFLRNATLVVCDKGYTKIQRKWREQISTEACCKVVEVETDIVIPVEIAYKKEAIGARVLRPKITEVLDKYLKKTKTITPKIKSIALQTSSLNIENPDKILKTMKIDESVCISSSFKGGYREAKLRLNSFIEGKVKEFDTLRNDPGKDYCSNLSPYLHFGQISPIEVALGVYKKNNSGSMAFIEELIIRRELAINFTHYNSNYESIRGIPGWAEESLKKHATDKRRYIYSLEQFENARTHDKYWNAAQKEMVITGKMHGYMRMYWGKKIIEWTKNPEDAFNIAIFLNNKYELDGRDPCSFTGVSWCFGTHDRGWKERDVFGKVRYMNAAGLERKFDISKYVDKIRRL